MNKLTVFFQWLLIEGFKASVLPAIVTGLVYLYWPRLLIGFLSLPLAELIASGLVLCAAGFLDIITMLSIKRISYPIVGSYVTSAAVFLLLTGSIQSWPDISKVVGTYSILSFLSVRFAAQTFEGKDVWFKTNKAMYGLAVTSVLLSESRDKSVQFMLVNNRNLNSGRGLWVSPGGRWSVGTSSPELRLLTKIAEEVNLRAEIKVWNSIENAAPPLSDYANSDCLWFRPPHFLLYETLHSQRSDFPNHHLDLIYVCRTNGETAERVPVYSPDKRIFVSVESCSKDFSSAYLAVSKAVGLWDRQANGQTRSLRDDISDDVVWRMYLVAKALNQSDEYVLTHDR